MRDNNKISYIPGNAEENQISYIPGDAKEEKQISYIPGDAEDEKLISYIPGNAKEENQISYIPGNSKEESQISYIPANTKEKDDEIKPILNENNLNIVNEKLKKVGNCPVCNGQVVKNSNKYSCQSCDYELKGEISNTVVPESYIRELLKGNYTDELILTNKEGKQYKSRLMLDKKYYRLCLAPSQTAKSSTIKRVSSNTTKKDKTTSTINSQKNNKPKQNYTKKKRNLEKEKINKRVDLEKPLVNDSVVLEESLREEHKPRKNNKKNKKSKFIIFIIVILLLFIFINQKNKGANPTDFNNEGVSSNDQTSLMDGQNPTNFNDEQDDEEKIEVLVKNYLESFTAAINRCDKELVFPYLTYNGELYQEQDKFVEYFYNKGIREQIEDFYITEINKISSMEYEVHVQEVFNILRNGVWEIREFKSVYRIKNINGEFLIDSLNQEEIHR